MIFHVDKEKHMTFQALGNRVLIETRRMMQYKNCQLGYYNAADTWLREGT